MKIRYVLLSFSLAIMLLGSCGSANKIMEPTAKSRALDEMITSKKFVFEAEWARPLPTLAMNSIMQSGLMPPGSSAAQINITGSSYYFRMEGDTVSAQLPYFGERQMGGGYGSDSGIDFKGVPEDLKIERDENKLSYSITFNISKEIETYRCRLVLSRNQRGNLLINSSQRFTIRYEGDVSAIEENTSAR